MLKNLLVSDSHREYLVKASEYRKANGKLLEVDPVEDTAWKNPDPRIRKAIANSTPSVSVD